MKKKKKCKFQFKLIDFQESVNKITKFLIEEKNAKFMGY